MRGTVGWLRWLRPSPSERVHADGPGRRSPPCPSAGPRRYTSSTSASVRSLKLLPILQRWGGTAAQAGLGAPQVTLGEP